jgi:hypothetical protein
MKIREMSKEQRNEYCTKKIKEWRLKNPEKNKLQRKKYKQGENGKLANLRYSKNHVESTRNYFRERYRKNPTTSKQSKEYIRDYMKEYMKNKENHRKYLIRQRDRFSRKRGLILLPEYCQLCGSQNNLEMHHKTYDESKDVIILCRVCHRKLHWKTKLTKEVK